MAHLHKPGDKRLSLEALMMTPAEWARVGGMIDLLGVCTDLYFLVCADHYLQHADRAQQVFSSEHEPTLHLAVPTFEALYRAWDVRTRRPKYSEFSTAIKIAMELLRKYYDRTADCSAYDMAACKSYLS